MRVRWFGDSWGAEICDPDYEIEVPIGTKCLECTRIINERDRGVVTGCSDSVWGHWAMKINGNRVTVCSYHLVCFLEQVVGGEWSHRMRSRLGRDRSMVDPEFSEPASFSDDEDVVPGRGWGPKVEEE